MLIEIATADAYGASFEFNKKPKVPNDLSAFGQHGLSTMPPGSYTDDTLRTLANAAVLLRGDAYDPAAYATGYIAIRAQDKRDGWSKRFAAVLDDHQGSTGVELMRNMKRRPTNGCVMGAAVLGFLPTPDDVRLAATMQTISTHSVSAVPYVQVVALAAHHLLRGGRRKWLIEKALDEAEWHSTTQRDEFLAMVLDPPEPDMPVETVAAGALHIVMNMGTCSSALKWACNSGLDTDSLAAVTIGLASVSDMAQDIPAHLLDTVDSFYNRAMLIETERQLRAMFL